MRQSKFSRFGRAGRTFVNAALAIISIILIATCAAGQDFSTTPSGAQSNGGIDSVNYYNGNHSFELPLLHVGGRGGAQMPLLMQIIQRFEVATTYDSYGLPHYYPQPSTTQTSFDMAYVPGYLFVYSIGTNDQGPCPDGPYVDAMYNNNTVTRLSFVGAGGKSYEFVDQLTFGKMLNPNFCYDQSTLPSRGRVFLSTDGSGATFIADNVVYDDTVGNGDGSNKVDTGVANGYAGVLLLSDGTQFRIDNYGAVSWIRDKNGNQINYSYELYFDRSLGVYGQYVERVTKITDSLNREIDIAYNVNDIAPYGLDDQITYKGFGGAARIIRVSKTSLANALRNTQSSDVSTPQTWATLFPYLNSASSVATFNPTVRSVVWLPSGQSYQFFYNAYGELARVVNSTGGASEYDTYDGTGGTGCPNCVAYPMIYRRVGEERSYVDGSTLTNRTTISLADPSQNGWNSILTVDHLDSTGNRLAREKHYYYFDAETSPNNGGGDPTFADNSWKEGKEYQTESYDFDGTTVLQRTTQTWQQGGTVPWWTGLADYSPSYNPRVIEQDTTLVPSNQVSKVIYAYDQYNNVTSTATYDFGNGAPGALLRSTVTTYVTTNSINGIHYDTLLPNATSPSTTSTVHIRNLPLQVSVYDANGTEQARTTFEYDNYAASGNHAALLNRSNITGLDSNFTTSKTTRGNVTSTSRYLLPAGTAVTGYAQYDITGNVVIDIGPLGHSSTFTFTDNFGAPNGSVSNDTTVPTELGTKSTFAFVTQITNALGQSAQTQFDYYLGKSVDVLDSNGVATSLFYNDSMDRQTQVISNATSLGGSKKQASLAYDDVNRIVTATTDLSSYNDNSVKSVTLHDGFERVTETRNYENSNTYITTKQVYDAMGRVQFATNPYRGAVANSDGWTRTTYDALGRMVEVATFSGTASNQPPNSGTTANWTGSLTTTYSGNQVTVTDQAAKASKTITDVLGHVTQAIEDPNGLNYQTSYGYDTLGDLTLVTQGSQTRTFNYDSLKRLTSATNPESGAVSYVYDNAGNLTSKTDAVGNVTSLSYDVINRIISKSYAVTSSTVATSTVNYFYDHQSLPSGAPSGFDTGYSVGRPIAITYGGSSAGTYYGYDAGGHVIRRNQQTDGTNYLDEATYDLAGRILSETYPSVPGATDRRTISAVYDNLARLTSVTSAATSYAGGASVSGIGYAPQGALASETYGTTTPLVHSLNYNSRLETTEIMLGTSSTPASVMDLSYDYGSTNNNGDVLSMTNSVISGKQFYSYDSLNRLTDAKEAAATGSPIYWEQTFSYDRYGNRTSTTATSSLGVFTPAPSIDTATNRFVATGGGFNYNTAGDLTVEPTSSGSLTSKFYTYDAENRLTNAKQGTSLATASDTGNYVYDGEGNRVKKTTQDNIIMVYGISGGIAAEFDVSSHALKKEYIYRANRLLATINPGSVTDPTKIQYLTGDHLGSPAVITYGDGSIHSRHDYLPFGEEIPAGVNGRTTILGFGVSDGIRQHFTQKERDTETGLDYFGARYYSNAQGRFTAEDPAGVSPDHISTPQKWNRYAYVLNNPLMYIDPDGFQEDFEIIINSFIPMKTVSVYTPVYDPDAGINVKERFFRGDNREPFADGAAEGDDAHHRTQQVFDIRAGCDGCTGMDNYNLSVNSYRPSIGITHETDENDNLITTDQASKDTVKYEVVENKSGKLVLRVQGNSPNPLVIGAPGIKYDLKITIEYGGPHGPIWVQVDGKTTGFPAFEVLVKRGNTVTNIWSRDPRTQGDTPIQLFFMNQTASSGTVTVEYSGPKIKKDDKEKKKKKSPTHMESEDSDH